MVTRTGRRIAFYVRMFSGSCKEDLENESVRGSRVVFWWNCHSRTRTTFVEDQIKAFGVRTKWVPSGGA